MPIQYLEGYLFERGLVGPSLPMDVLKNCRIGIDAEHYFNRLLSHKKEVFYEATGGFPLSLRLFIDSDLATFRDNNITPIFVFPGLKITTNFTRYSKELTKFEKNTNNVWDKVLKNNLSGKASFGENFRMLNTPIHLEYLLNDLLLLLMELNVDYLIAPYDSTSQLSYMYNEKMIDIIYGSTDLLLTKIDKFIIGIELPQKEFRVLDKYKILNDLNLAESQLLDIAIIVGFNLQPKQFPIFQNYNMVNYIKLVLDIIYNGSADLYKYLIGINTEKSWLDLFQKIKLTVNYVPVLTQTGSLEYYFKSIDPQSELQVPNDVHELIGQRLPVEFYFYLAIGLLPAKLLESITTGTFYVRPSIDGGQTSQYRKLIASNRNVELMNQKINLIVMLLARYYQVKKINLDIWFSDDKTLLNDRMNPSVNVLVNKLVIKNQSDEFDLTKVVKLIGDSKYQVVERSKERYSKENEEFKLTNKSDILSTGLLRSLYLLQYVDKDYKLTKWGKVLSKLSQLEHSSTYITQILLLLNFVKSDDLRLSQAETPDLVSCSSFYKTFGAEKKLTPEERKNIFIISRVFTFLTVNHKSYMYQGPISRSLLSFRSHIDYLKTQFRELIETNILNLLVNNETDIRLNYNNRDWHELIKNIPFFANTPNTIMGIIAEIYFEYSVNVSKEKAENAGKTIEYANEHLLETFSGIIPTVVADVKEGIKFWKLALDLFKLLREENLVSQDYLDDLVNADAWMQNFI